MSNERIVRLLDCLEDVGDDLNRAADVLDDSKPVEAFLRGMLRGAIAIVDEVDNQARRYVEERL